MACALPAPWMIPDFPEDSKLLSPEERQKWLSRLSRSQGITNASLPLNKEQVYRGLLDWRGYIYSFTAMGAYNNNFKCLANKHPPLCRNCGPIFLIELVPSNNQ